MKAYLKGLAGRVFESVLSTGVLLLVIMCLTAWAKAQIPMTTYTYRIEHARDLERINQLGKEGWDIADTNGGLVYMRLLSRPPLPR